MKESVFGLKEKHQHIGSYFQMAACGWNYFMPDL